jgi:stearoyl-CoA desaturase (delta-9 desaturase)
MRPFAFNAFTMMIYQVIITISFITWLYFGTLNEWLIVVGVYFLRGILLTSVVHRGITHRAFEMPKWLEYLLSSIALAGSSTSVLAFATIHREHHKFSDTTRDPHSPKHIGWVKVHLRNGSLNLNLRYSLDILRSKFYIFMHNWHWLFSFIFIAILYSIDPRSIFYAFLVPNFILWHSGCIVNSLNHCRVGYRNYNTDDNSSNSLLTGYITFGEGWHNNHHNNSSNPKFGEKWWEVDLGWWAVKLIRTNK